VRRLLRLAFRQELGKRSRGRKGGREGGREGEREGGRGKAGP
jgi:hypothetical protein